MVDDKLAREEAQRAANYEGIKSDVKAEVGGEIVAEAQVPSSVQSDRATNPPAGYPPARAAIDSPVCDECDIRRSTRATAAENKIHPFFPS